MKEYDALNSIKARANALNALLPKLKNSGKDIDETADLSSSPSITLKDTTQALSIIKDLLPVTVAADHNALLGTIKADGTVDITDATNGLNKVLGDMFGASGTFAKFAKTTAHAQANVDALILDIAAMQGKLDEAITTVMNNALDKTQAQHIRAQLDDAVAQYEVFQKAQIEIDIANKRVEKAASEVFKIATTGDKKGFGTEGGLGSNYQNIHTTNMTGKTTQADIKTQLNTNIDTALTQSGELNEAGTLQNSNGQSAADAKDWDPSKTGVASVTQLKAYLDAKTQEGGYSATDTSLFANASATTTYIKNNADLVAVADKINDAITNHKKISFDGITWSSYSGNAPTLAQIGSELSATHAQAANQGIFGDSSTAKVTITEDTMKHYNDAIDAVEQYVNFTALDGANAALAEVIAGLSKTTVAPEVKKAKEESQKSPSKCRASAKH